ncbi:MAG: hypothetical protein Q8N51_06225 [Gammaproteobacteria bacterium]|nr:hypothetical protein [Gammaproteobacteria bacterium]
MRKIEQIEQQIKDLPPDEFSELCQWIAALDAEAWDAQIEADVRGGRLDAFAEQALAAHAAGKSTRL